MGPQRSQSKQRSKVLAPYSLLSVTVVVCTAAAMAAGASTPARSGSRALVVPSTYPGRCHSGIGTCQVRVPASLRSHPVRLPAVARGAACPASGGASVTHPGVAGVALGKGPVTAFFSEHIVVKAVLPSS